MYIYKFICEIKWSNWEDGDDNDTEYYDVTGRDFRQALSKLEKIALNKKRGFKSEEGGFIYPVEIVDISNMEKGDFIDG